jgi:glucosylglycerol phosphorylase (configuration-retaining)
VDLIRFRNTHAAFAGKFHMPIRKDDEICMEWRNGSEQARLDVDLKSMEGAIAYSADGRQDRFEVAP